MPPPRMGPPDCMYPHHHPVTFLCSPWKAGTTVLVTRRLQASGALGPPSVNAWATHLTLISQQPREILQGPQFLG